MIILRNMSRSAEMDLSLVVVKTFIRSRHRSCCLQGCVMVFLVLVAFTVVLHMIMNNTVWSEVKSQATKRSNGSLCATWETTVGITVDAKSIMNTEKESLPIPTIFAITPTRRTLTQLLELTSLCQTLMNVKNLVWIVVEASFKKTVVVSGVLGRCQVQYVHLVSSLNRGNTPVSTKYPVEYPVGHGFRRGILERKVGLDWIKHYCSQFQNCTGTVYFMNDESKYDLRLFDQVRQVDYVGVWPVAYTGRLKFEGPVCVNGTSREWHSVYSRIRPFPISATGFAVNIRCLLDHPEANYGFAPNSTIKSLRGWEESDFLSNFLHNKLDPRLECKGSDKEAYVWNVQSQIYPYLRKHKYQWKYKLRT